MVEMSVGIKNLKMKEKIKCSKCPKDALIFEEKIYYCADCYIIIKRIKIKNAI